MDKKFLLLLVAGLWTTQGILAQCADSQNVFPFTFEGKTYEIIKENKSWTDAAACAVSRGGYLAEINSLAENQAIFNQLANAGVNPANTQAPDGFSSYVWLGGNDIATEGVWVWNGNNSATNAIQFWQGTVTGNAVGGLFSYWGNEPDNWGGGPGQDGLGMSVINWPNGPAGRWNDINHNNLLYFVVEYSSLMGSNDIVQPGTVAMYPNPATDVVAITVENGTPQTISIFNAAGQEVKFIPQNALADNKIDIQDLPAGIYFINVTLEYNRVVTQKLIKK